MATAIYLGNVPFKVKYLFSINNTFLITLITRLFIVFLIVFVYSLRSALRF